RCSIRWHASGGPLSCSGKKGAKEPAREGEDSESLPPPWTLLSFKRPKGVIPLLENPEIPPALAIRTKRDPGVRITRRICKL
ncbi:MAG: hypothetical protein IKO68_09100, partial [Oscillospiraceae bacterium]|nr:hypothetical protein [Oscillospiraceae bacterium]